MLYKGSKLINFGPHARLTSWKEYMQNMLKLVDPNGRNHIPDILLENFSTTRVASVRFPGKIVLQIKIAGSQGDKP
jgi:hypothetical protein